MAPNRCIQECPHCHRMFESAAAVVRHLNHPYTSCTNWFIPPDTQSNATYGPARVDTEVPLGVKFPYSGYVFGQGATFMDHFCTDKLSDRRATNLYFPFASRDEWELAEFLSQANISMKVIDKFLSLRLVSCCLSTSLGACGSPSKHRFATLVYLFVLQRHSVALLNSSLVDPSGCRKKSTFLVVP